MGIVRNEAGAATLCGLKLDALFDGGALDRDGAAVVFETPAYVYDLDAIGAEVRELRAAFDASLEQGASTGEQASRAGYLIAYAVKANSAGPILRTVAALGAGADVVSGAELELALRCGIAPTDIVFSGVAKQNREIDLAINAGGVGILALQIESVEELPRVEARAAHLGRRARVSFRINPGIEADTHAHIATGHDEAKFGIARDDLPLALEALRAAPHVDLVGMGGHVGSQLTAVDDYIASARRIISLYGAVEASLSQAGRSPLQLIDFGGGFGIDYGSGCPVRPADFARALSAEVRRARLDHLRIIVEPGRSMVGAHGVLVSSVIMSKRAAATATSAERRWLMIDAGMNDLIRPALYQALHRIEPTSVAPHNHDVREGSTAYRVVGPVCESSDDFGTHRFELPPARVVIRDAGAYGFTMASEYNGRPLPIEIFLAGGRVAETIAPRRAESWIDERFAKR